MKSSRSEKTDIIEKDSAAEPVPCGIIIQATISPSDKGNTHQTTGSMTPINQNVKEGFFFSFLGGKMIQTKECVSLSHTQAANVKRRK